jgi:hypothetical protein
MPGRPIRWLLIALLSCGCVGSPHARPQTAVAPESTLPETALALESAPYLQPARTPPDAAPHDAPQSVPILLRATPAAFESIDRVVAAPPGGPAIAASDPPPRPAAAPSVPAQPTRVLSLIDAERLALAGDPRVQAASTAVERAQAHADAVGLEYGPWLRGDYSYISGSDGDDDRFFRRGNHRGQVRVGIPILERHLQGPHRDAERRASVDIALAELRQARADALAAVRRIYLEALRDRAWVDAHAPLERQAAELLPRIEEAARRKEVLAPELIDLRQALEASRRQIAIRRHLYEQRLALLAGRVAGPVQLAGEFHAIHERCRVEQARLVEAIAAHPSVVATLAEGARRAALVHAHRYDQTWGRVELGYVAEDNVVSGSDHGASAALRVQVPLRQRDLRQQAETESSLLDWEYDYRAQAQRELLTTQSLEKFSDYLNQRSKQADLAIQLEQDNAARAIAETRRKLGQQTADVSEWAEWQAKRKAALTAAALRDADLQAEIAFYEFLHTMACELETGELPQDGVPSAAPVSPRPPHPVHDVVMTAPDSKRSGPAVLRHEPIPPRGLLLGADECPGDERQRAVLDEFCLQRTLTWLLVDKSSSRAATADTAETVLLKLDARAMPIWFRAVDAEDAVRLAEHVRAGSARGLVVPAAAADSQLRARLGPAVCVAVEIDVVDLVADRLRRNSLLTQLEAIEPQCVLVAGDLDALASLDVSVLPARIPTRLLVRLPAAATIREADLEARFRTVLQRLDGRDVHLVVANYSAYRDLATR